MRGEIGSGSGFGPADRAARGKAARRAVPRASHARWGPAPDRPDPVGLLQAQAAARIPELVPVRHGRMLASPFAFFRGAAAVMAADLSGSPASGFRVQLCGDAHLANFGAFASPERRMVFDVNDFDETLPGPWEWDVKRLGASFEIGARELGFRAADRRAIVLAAVAAYREAMRDAAGQGVLEVWYAQLAEQQFLEWLDEEVRHKRLGRQEAREALEDIARARARDHARLLAKRTTWADGRLRIAADPPLIVPIEELVGRSNMERVERGIRAVLGAYRQTLAHDHHPLDEFEYVHAARKVVGVGSVGTHCYVVLLVGRDTGDPLFLQVKEAQASVLERHLQPSGYRHEGRRVVAGQRRMQATSDIFLGWQRSQDIDGRTRDFYVRQLHDWKGGAEVDTFRVPGATLYARMCGLTLARGHARSGDRIAIARYLGKRDAFDRAIADFAAGYADQNERDFEVFRAAVRSGRLAARAGV